MISIDEYDGLEYRNQLSSTISGVLGCKREVDIYWSYQNHNYVITPKGKKTIIKECLKGQPVYVSGPQGLQKRWQEIEYGPKMRDELKLQDIAVKANNDKLTAENREMYERTAADGWDVARKHSVVV